MPKRRSHCQLCRLPLNQDHHVPVGAYVGDVEDVRTWRTREGDDQGVEPVVAFGDEHDWLFKAVAITDSYSHVLTGAVVDGAIEDMRADEPVALSGDDVVSLHRYCWELMGKPETPEECVRSWGLHESAIIDAYHGRPHSYGGELFAHANFRDHGLGWMLEDPSTSERSRARIDALLVRARERPVVSAEQLTTVKDVVRAERGWYGSVAREQNGAPRTMSHTRSNLRPELDVASYPGFIRASLGVSTAGFGPETVEALLRYERAVIAAVEADDAAICVNAWVAADGGGYCIYARDLEATTRVLKEVARPTGAGEPDCEAYPDPSWSEFFDTMKPRVDPE